MTVLKELLLHSSNYFVGRVLVLLGGFISMPILTRILSKEDYGLLSLVLLSLTLFSTVAAFGFPQATIRFYADYKTKRGRRHLQQFCTSMSLGSAVTGAVAVVIAIGISYLFENSGPFIKLAHFVRYASILIFIRVISGVIQQIYRADKVPLAFNIILISNRYLAALLGILLVVYIYKNIKGVLIGTILVEGAVVIIGLFALYFNGKLGPSIEPPEFLLKAVKFGFPLVVADLLATIVATSDRFAIQYFMNSGAVASYSIVYDISEYIAAIFASPIQLAIMPIIFELWVKEGYEKTSYFVSQAIKYAFVIIIPIIFGFSVVGENIIIILASEKYAESSALVPFVITGVMLSSIHFLFFVGLMVEKKTGFLAILNCGAAVLNVGLNIILIPRYGILGSAYAMFFTYFILITVTYRASSKYLKVAMNFGVIVRSILISAFMVLFLKTLGSLSNSLVIDLIVKSIVGCLFYVIVVLIADKDIRKVTLGMV